MMTRSEVPCQPRLAEKIHLSTAAVPGGNSPPDIASLIFILALFREKNYIKLAIQSNTFWMDYRERPHSGKAKNRRLPSPTS